MIGANALDFAGACPPVLARPTKFAKFAPAAKNRAATAALLAALASCSSLPDRQRPDHTDWTFRANLTADAEGRIAFPSTTAALVVEQVELLPAPEGELLLGGERWFLYPAGTRVDIHASLRVYANSDGSQPTLEQLLPGATVIARTPQ
ncbi:MAG: hypothetical protein AB8H80_07770 [Planctomycetota bacterium]